MQRTVAYLRLIVLFWSMSVPAMATAIDVSIDTSSPFCVASSTEVTYDTHGITFDTNNVLAVQLSDANGSFANPSLIGTLATSSTTGVIPVTFPTSALGTGYRVRVVSSLPLFVGSDNGVDFSIAAPTPVSVSISVSPGNVLCNTTAATFTATATNPGSLPVFEWKVNDLTVGSNSSVFDATNLADGDVVKCYLTSNAACATPAQAVSNQLNMVVKNIVAPSVTIAGALPICSGQDVEFTATAINGGLFPAYQWKKNGTPVGTNSATFVSNDLATSDVLTCVLTSSRECLTNPVTFSNALTVVVTPTVAPTIEISSSATNVVGANSQIYFSSNVTNAGTAPVYEWRRNGGIAGHGNAFSSTTLVDGDQITATVFSNATCASPLSATSNTITVSIDNNLTKTGHAWDNRAPQLDGFGQAIDRRNASGFSIGNKAYIGAGFSMAGTVTVYRRDFWEYDPATDVWTQKADVPGPGRHSAVGFSVTTKGYIGLGLSAVGVRKDFYQYDPVSNTWLQRLDYPGPAREQAFGFSIGFRGYVGGGFANGQGDFKDFYEFDPAANNWFSRADFGGGKRFGSATFVVDNKGYVAAGYSSSTDTYFKDLWEYDPSSSSWKQKTDLPGKERARATGFAVGGSGYVGLGVSRDGYEGQFYQYSSSTDTWSQKAYYTGPMTPSYATGVSIGNRAFLYKDGSWVEYNLFTLGSFTLKFCTTEGITLNWDASSLAFGVGNVFTVQVSSQPNFSSVTNAGSVASTQATGTLQMVVPATQTTGTYFVRLQASNPPVSTFPELISLTGVATSHTITTNNGTSICKEVPVTFQSNLTGSGFQWLRNGLVVGNDSPTYTDSPFSNGDVVKAVRYYTVGCKNPVGVSSNQITMSVREALKPVVIVLPNILQSTPAAAYQWYQDGVTISGATSQSYKMTKAGIYKVKITDGSGCTAFSDDVANAYVGLDDPIDDEFVVYPNPTTKDVYLQLPDECRDGCQFFIYNPVGQNIYTGSTVQKINVISIKDAAPGLYIVRLNIGGKVATRKFLKVE